MHFDVGNIYNGFKLLSEKKVKEVNSISRLFYHEKSGARLLSLENDDDNKVFSISFRTPPKDSTGLPHILEHSVLCGSRKFPTKEPFVELVKGSLNTFLNALTFSDKTMYPVASKNDKDFYNLMDVYLDAVFYPNIYKYPEILMQEGWHYDIDNKEGEITYKGVVYNEMKGAFSSPESILFRKIQESLFPDTPYGVESGGDPEVIPELTQEEFLKFHQKYYHPSNSYIFLYGNGDILKQLAFINDNYLKGFDAIKVDSGIPLQQPFKEIKEMEVMYPVLPEDDEKDKAYLSMNFAVGKSMENETILALQVLEHLLLETPAAPLKKALIEAEIGKDVLGQYDNSILQPVISIVVKNSNEDKKEKFKSVIYDTLKNLAENGIDKKLIEASINIIEFDLRESEGHGMPKGLLYSIKAMNSWLYDKDPEISLEYELALEKIKTALISDYFEKLIEKYLINNTHCSLLVLKPQKSLEERKAEEIKSKLSSFKKSLTDEQIEELIEQTDKLRERQSKPDSPEVLATIPLLNIEDISKEALKLELDEDNYNQVKIFRHSTFTNKIAYVNLYFDSSFIEQDDLQYIGLLSDILCKISTEKYDYSDLSNEINIHTGGIHSFVEAYSVNGDSEKYYPKFIFKSKALVGKMPELFNLLNEIISASRYDETKRLKEIIQETRSQLEMRIFERGHLVAARRLSSYYSPSGYYLELISGLSYYKFIVGIEKNYDSKAQEIIANLKKVAGVVFSRKNLIFGVTCDEKDYDAVKSEVVKLIDALKDNDQDVKKYKFDLKARNEGLMTPGKVQYVAKGYNYIKTGYAYSGKMQVLRTIAGYDYLWNHIRVRGGAYGAFNRFERNGNVYFASYRDPNLAETLKVYDNTAEYLKNFNVDEREMTKYIIGTISKLDTPLTPSVAGEVAIEYHLRNVLQEDIQRERDEVLNTTLEDIRAFADMVLEVMKQNYFCVLGSEEKIKQNKDIFSEVTSVFE
ncbi:peptidase M16C associated [Oxobacter pfennigii]|uniref:Peptidase M16C associated n=1 Tax=Oxobacter pfennigii TaxID=36849 RepID=A0A0P9AC55_9CLOT|nr:insulinase family protein [Oxobacter pfennigii]KPU42675.1 peptidase M16C associated [Oxobacter pfennigii]